MGGWGWRLNGIDEAGYGPRLGPLVQACASWREAPAAEPFDFDDWEAVSAAVASVGARVRAQASAAGLRVGDSKQLFSQARRGPPALPDGAGTPGSAAGAQVLWRALMAVGGADSGAARAGWPEWVTVEEEQHASEEHPSAGLAREVLGDGPAGARAAAGPLALHAICLYPRQFNAWAGAKNKAEINWELTRRLVRARLATAARGGASASLEPTVWTLDRQGGRKQYAGLLGEVFAPAYVQIVMETAPLCVYRLRGDAVNAWVTVKVDGEDWSVGTALASMAAKALREAAMARLNGYYCSRHPGLRPTAGYPVDADRWRAALRELDGEQPWDRVWRCK